MLYWFDSDCEVKDIPHSRKSFYEKGKNNLTIYEYNNLKAYINELIDCLTVKNESEDKFLVPGWQVPGTWKYIPLDIIWEKVYNGSKENCALWYGLLVMETIIERDEKWMAIKTNFSREFDQTVYWIKNQYQE